MWSSIFSLNMIFHIDAWWCKRKTRQEKHDKCSFRCQVLIPRWSELLFKYVFVLIHNLAKPFLLCDYVYAHCCSRFTFEGVERKEHSFWSMNLRKRNLIDHRRIHPEKKNLYAVNLLLAILLGGPYLKTN